MLIKCSVYKFNGTKFRLHSGVYFVKVQTPKGVSVKSIVKK
ncbi:T9SS type A sorting domain-containing protein [Flavicella sediminum]